MGDGARPGRLAPAVRQEVLRRLAAGETVPVITRATGVGDPTVRRLSRRHGLPLTAGVAGGGNLPAERPADWGYRTGDRMTWSFG